MTDSILTGRRDQIVAAPRKQWEEVLSQVPARMETRLAFLSPPHHLVRNFVVSELPRHGQAIPTTIISKALRLSLDEVERIVDELESNLFFLVRDERGAVSWAFPVTVEKTPHHLSFSTGEHVYAAWAEDAIAAPFVQGRLQKEHLAVTIRTECAQSGWPLHLTVDSDLNCGVEEEGAQPLVFEPEVDWGALREPNIIRVYWRNSLFFWSEEYARQFRRERGAPDGIYLTMEQMAYSTRIAQAALFAFS